MKDELHAKLWQAQQRWFSLKDQGYTKHDLKVLGLPRSRRLRASRAFAQSKGSGRGLLRREPSVIGGN
jgi:hypothetical protein